MSKAGDLRRHCARYDVIIMSHDNNFYADTFSRVLSWACHYYNEIDQQRVAGTLEGTIRSLVVCDKIQIQIQILYLPRLGHRPVQAYTYA